MTDVFDKKICVLGGGVSGLACATYLQDMGYRHVTVLEKEPLPGGKAHTAFVDGLPFDMGALEYNRTDTYTLDLMERFNVEGVHIKLIELIDDATGEISPMTDLVPGFKEKAQAVAQSLEYLKAVIEHVRFANGPDFEGLPHELAVPFSEWLETNGLTELRWIFEGVLFTFGYGKQTELPAAYVLKFMHWQNFLTVLGMFGYEVIDHAPNWPRSIDGGFQRLFREVGASIRDLRLNVRVTKIARDQPGEHPVVVTYTDASGAERTEGFDRLIMTALPKPDEIGQYLDLTDRERELFSDVVVNHYWSILIRHPDLEREDLLVLQRGGERALPDTGDPVAYVCNHAESDVFVVNAYSEADTTIEQMRENILSTFERMGLAAPTFPETDDGNPSWNKWEFFPHVSAERMAQGFYTDVAMLQGQHDTYWAGGLYNFEIVESTLHNANDLIETKFSESSWSQATPRRVAVVGAGPAGLSAAYYLHEKGYDHVTVLEKNAWVGGKVHSYIDSGGRAYDMGALEVTKEYVNTLDLIDRFQIELYPIQPLKLIDGQTGEVSPLTELTPSTWDKVATGAAALKYGAKLLEFHRWLHQPDMRGIPDELTAPFGQWLSDHGMEALKVAFMPATFCYGYGDIDNYAAGYGLKYMKKYNFEALVSVLLREQLGLDPVWPKSITGGFQLLFERIAAALPDVRTGVTDLKIDRREDGVTVTYTRDGASHSEEFDDVIVTAAQETRFLEPFLELTDEERRLFDQVTHDQYYTVAVDASGFTTEELYILMQDGSYGIPEDGDPVSFIRHFAETDTLVMYCYAKDPISEAEMLERMKAAITRMGGSEIDVKATFEWAYFPHVSPESLRDGFYDDLHLLQSRNRTYYSGGLLNFEDVENTVTYSKYLVDTFF
jgi:protoporphyrinogen oxidase